MRKAIIAMSGGVDSSVAALLTKESGDECIGATMKLYHNEDIGVKRENTCCSLDDVEDVEVSATEWELNIMSLTFQRDLKKMSWIVLCMRMNMAARRIHVSTATAI